MFWVETLAFIFYIRSKADYRLSNKKEKDVSRKLEELYGQNILSCFRDNSIKNGKKFGSGKAW